MKTIKIRVCGKCGLETVEKLRACSRCRLTYYCSPECQKADWSIHKLVCKNDVIIKDTFDKFLSIMKSVDLGEIQAFNPGFGIIIFIPNTSKFIDRFEKTISKNFIFNDLKMENICKIDVYDESIYFNKVKQYIDEFNLHLIYQTFLEEYEKRKKSPVSFILNDLKNISFRFTERQKDKLSQEDLNYISKLLS